MLDCAWNPTRQPARSSPTAVVTTTSGWSSDSTIRSKSLSLMPVSQGHPLVAGQTSRVPGPQPKAGFSLATNARTPSAKSVPV